MVTRMIRNTSDIVHDIKMTFECIVIPQKRYIVMHDLVVGHNSKSTRTLLECTISPILEYPGII